MVALGLGNIKSGLKYIAPLIAGGIAGEILMGKIPIETYAQKVPFIKDAPAIVQRFAPAALLALGTVIIFKKSDIGSARWSIMSLLAGASVGMTVNVAAKAIQRGGASV